MSLRVGLNEREEGDVGGSLDSMAQRSSDPITLLSGMREIVDAPSADAVIARVLSLVKETMLVEAAYWMDVHEGRAVMRAVAGLGRPELMLGTSFKTSEGIGGIALSTAKPYFARDYLHDPAAVASLVGFVRDEGITGLLAVPVFLDGEPSAILYLLTRGDRDFTADDERYLLVLSTLAARASAQRTAADDLRRENQRLVESIEHAAREDRAVGLLGQLLLGGKPLATALNEVSLVLGTQLEVRTDPAEPPTEGVVTPVPGAVGTYFVVENEAALSDRGLQQVILTIALVLARGRAVAETRLLLEGRFVQELLHASPEVRAKAARAAHAGGVDVQSERLVVAIGASEPLDQPIVDHLVAQLRSMSPRSLAAVHEGRLIVLWPQADGASTGEITSGVAQLLMSKQHRLSAGIGGVAALTDSAMPTAVKEALFAQRIAQSRSAGPPVFDIAGAGMYRIFSQVTEVGDLRETVQETLGPLIEEDRRRGSDLVLTLRTFLEHDRRVNATARTLNLHPNSLRYRMDSISKLLNVNLDDPDTRFFTLMALRLSTDLPGVSFLDSKPPHNAHPPG